MKINNGIFKTLPEKSEAKDSIIQLDDFIEFVYIGTVYSSTPMQKTVKLRGWLKGIPAKDSDVEETKKRLHKDMQ